MLKAQIVGNIGSDPELKHSASGSPLLRFNVASNGRTKNAAGAWEDTTEWIRVTVFGQRAESLAPHLTRGARVYVDGRLETRPWIDRSNEPRAGLELVADSVEFTSARGPSIDLGELDDGPIGVARADRPGERKPEATAVAGARGAPTVANRNIDGLDDPEELPF